MVGRDLPAVEGWLRRPHVARWWAKDVTVEVELANIADTVTGPSQTTILVVAEGGTDVGWCQWYRWSDYPDEARAMGAQPGEVGIDYAIGEPAAVGRGVGTALIRALVAEVRRHHAGAGVLVAPHAANLPSRRVLEKNGFVLVEVRPVATELSDDPMAIYRQPPPP